MGNLYGCPFCFGLINIYEKIKVSIAGASGYAGGETLRLLIIHPQVTIVAATSEKSAGKSVSATFPALSAFVDLSYEALDPESLAKKSDLIFLALPITDCP